MNKEFIKWLSQPAQMSHISSSPTQAERERRKAELKKRFEMQSGNFSSVNFSANPYVEDGGNPAADESGIYDDCSTFAEYSAKAREVSAFGRIKSLVANSNVRESVKQWAMQKNEITRRNKAKKAEKEALAKDKFVSHPNWF